ncbi:hypothetical protein PoB_005992400 [Plakobranchus ocellatus]|uniref:Uncharacterized protein n=1 Tax=Plakobranchus ocellatus TaxID=259542 RepID=A0AAV4CNG7_9GAST|nr:hypothetical protein PoB_005992400 [Plakobranchus ocellatus]
MTRKSTFLIPGRKCAILSLRQRVFHHKGHNVVLSRRSYCTFYEGHIACSTTRVTPWFYQEGHTARFTRVTSCPPPQGSHRGSTKKVTLHVLQGYNRVFHQEGHTEHSAGDDHTLCSTEVKTSCVSPRRSHCAFHRVGHTMWLTKKVISCIPPSG